MGKLSIYKIIQFGSTVGRKPKKRLDYILTKVDRRRDDGAPIVEEEVFVVYKL